MRVLVVDDHPVVRFGLVGLLSRDFEVIEAATGEESLTKASGVQVVLMDLQLGKGIDGVEATRRIRALENGPHVVILTTYDSDADIVRAVEAGAIGYLLKDCDPEDLFEAVHTASTGQTVLSPDIAQRLLGQVRDPAPKVSKREIQILECLARGLANKDIGNELFISQSTVKTHLVRIFMKLGVETRTAAVKAAVERKLIRL
ncbi:response regulator [Lentzea sp. NPDC060358]|uniref:response regulator n=1 Tax=Lentzea sp. NPDC060358 TaxID=3347103 RepID=UPI003669FEA4